MATSSEPAASGGGVRRQTGSSNALESRESGTEAGAEASAKRYPDFFIVGHPKSGTTALYEMLRSHPQIFMPDFKEPRYFSPDLPSPFGERASGAPPKTLDYYLSLFAEASPDQRLGEASTAYIWSESAARLIADAQPAARIIAVLREPASFVHSLHMQLLQGRVEKETRLRKALALEDERRRGRHLGSLSRWPQILLYSDRVRYVEQLRRYHAVFPPEQVLVLIYDDFRADNEGTVRRVLRFLDVDDTVAIEAKRANPSVRMRSSRLDDVVRVVSVGKGSVPRAVRSTIKALTPRRLRVDVHRAIRTRMVYGRPKPPEEDLVLELRRRYAGEVVALSEYLGRDLVSLWGYDRLD